MPDLNLEFSSLLKCQTATPSFPTETFAEIGRSWIMRTAEIYHQVGVTVISRIAT